MAQLDKLIEKIQPNQEIILESGKSPVLKSDTGSAPMLNQQLSPAQIIGLIQEIAPAASKAGVTLQNFSRFEYTVGAKTVAIVCEPEGGHP